MTLLFHPDFIRGTSLSREMNKYSFFSYELNEALHLSERKRQIIQDLFNKIDYELDQAIDNHSKTLIANNIELLLNDYFESEKPQLTGLPSVSYFADKLNLPANYFGDLIKKETGKTAQEHIHLKLIDKAKEKIFDTTKSISQIAYELGFQYPQHFSRMFKNETGYSPNEYRSLN